MNENMNEVDVEYYDLTGKDLHFKICPGDLYVICNVLYDYHGMLHDLLGNPPEEVSEETIMLWDARYSYYLEKIEKIRGKIENAIGYSTEKAIEKCRKKSKQKESDIGEDALVMALKVRITEKPKKEDPVKEDKKKETTRQLSIFDMEGLA